MLLGLATVKFFFLVCEESLERLLHLWSDDGNESNQIDSLVDELLAECYDHDNFLQVHFNYSLPDERCTEERPEWHQEVAASNSSEIEQWVWNLKRKFMKHLR